MGRSTVVENRGKTEAAAQRRLLALDMRTAGATYESIGKALGISVSQAYKDVAKSLAAIRAEQDLKAEDLRTLENKRLDKMLLAIWPQAIAGKLFAVDRVLAISERRARLNGLDAPVKHELIMPEELKMLIVEMGIPIEQVWVAMMQMAIRLKAQQNAAATPPLLVEAVEVK